MASKPNQINKEEFRCALCHLWVRDHFWKPCYHGTPHCPLCLQEVACPGTWQASCPQVSSLTAALGAAGRKGKKKSGPLQAEPVCRSHQQRHQLVLIRKVFGGFNLFCFPDVDSRPAKRGLQKKKQCVPRKDTVLGRQLYSRPRGGRLLWALMRTGCSRPSPQGKGLCLRVQCPVAERLILPKITVTS